MSVERRLANLEQNRRCNADLVELDLETLSEADRATLEAASEAIAAHAGIETMSDDERQLILSADRILSRDPEHFRAENYERTDHERHDETPDSAQAGDVLP